jgi:hypothetical protein
MSDYHKNKNCVNVDKSASLDHCDNTTVDPILTPAGERTVHVPVDLGVYRVSSNLEAHITFPEPVMEIKDVKKNVEIVQCRLMTIPTSNGDFSEDGAQFPLLLSGYVRKNIQYATPCGGSGFDGSCVSSDIKSLTVRVPFKCMTTITLDSPVQLPRTNNRQEFDFFRAQNLGTGYPEKDQYLSNDISQFHQFSNQFYNQLPYCELLSSSILEWDESTDRVSEGPVGEGYFYNMLEKMSLNFTIKVLQNQQVRIDALDADA